MSNECGGVIAPTSFHGQTGFVYRWTNKINGKKYIGSHIGTLDDGYTGSGSVFRRAVAKHGIESFEREILDLLPNCSREMLNEREQHFLDINDAAKSRDYYNVRAKVGGGFEHINNDPVLKEASRTRILQYTHLSSRHKGKKHSAETRAIQREKSLKWSRENVARSIWCFTLTGELVCRYDAITDAATAVGGSPSNIKYTAEGKFRHAYGYLWSYSDTVQPLEQANRSAGRKAIVTPVGTFESVKATMEHYGYASTVSVRQKCLSAAPKWSGWYYEIDAPKATD